MPIFQPFKHFVKLPEIKFSRIHNHEVPGSIPGPATKKKRGSTLSFFVYRQDYLPIRSPSGRILLLFLQNLNNSIQ